MYETLLYLNMYPSTPIQKIRSKRVDIKHKDNKII